MLLLKILEKLGRMKVVMDRGPSHKDYHLAKPWTKRYYLLFRYRPRWFPFNILINHIAQNGVMEVLIKIFLKLLKVWVCGHMSPKRKNPKSSEHEF